MATKKKRKLEEIKARKKKKNRNIFFLSFMLCLMIGFLIFFFVSLFDYLYPPTAGKGILAIKKERHEIQLFFSDPNERFLIPEKRYIPKEKTAKGQATELVKALIEGPKTELVRTLPENTELQDIQVKKDGTAYISFGNNLIDLHPGGSTSEMTTIHSLANTLAFNVSQIKQVRLLINNSEIKTIKGHIDTTHSFGFNKDLIVKNIK